MYAGAVTSRSFESPIGWVRVDGTEAGVHAISFEEARPADQGDALSVVDAAIAQLNAYFAGTLRDFDLQLAAEGTPFQHQVWNLLRALPFGKTCSYMDLAVALQNVKAIRAVGAANGRNPIAIVVPCHRVIGSDGSLTGYAGGMHRKQWLLRHEQETLFGKQPTLFS